jgi:endonuclease/exonuclease/phosphatase (EEP) superfamily protein YafD
MFAGAATLFATFTLALTLVPLAYRADQATAGGLRLKVVSLNLWVGNDDVDKAARFLTEEAADVVVLQEADRLHRPLMERVKGSYPHAYCPDRVCSIALLSRIPWIEAGKEDVPPRRPLLVWARIAQEGGTVRVIGTHLSYPFRSEQQAAQTQWLIGYLQRQTEPTVIAGDFNLTPFSWKMLELLHRTGLKIHLLAGFSWPAHRYRPAVLLDNVLSTPHFGMLSARVGPSVDSDHRPVIVELARR